MDVFHSFIRRLNILKEQLIKFLATGCGSGCAPVAPGTAGTILGVLLFFLLSCFSGSVYLFFLLVFTAVAVYVAREAEFIFGQKDAPCIVIDEVAGLLWTMLFVSPAISAVITGFILFRFFDIVKPFPVRLLEDKLPGGYGVVGDDVMAGIYSNIALQVLIKFFVI